MGVERFKTVEAEIAEKQSELNALRHQIAAEAKRLGIGEILGARPLATIGPEKTDRFIVVRKGGTEAVHDAAGDEIRFKVKRTVLRGDKYRHLQGEAGDLELFDEETQQVVASGIEVK